MEHASDLQETAPFTDRDGKRIVDLMRSVLPPSGPLFEAGSHHFARPGKLFRGRLAVSIASALRVPRVYSLRVAAASELLHNASLLHDDVQDGDVMRRGQLTVWHAFGTDVAINLGDYLLVRAIELASGCPDRAIVSDFTRAAATTIRGQADEMVEKAKVVDLDRYEAIAKAKTGPLLALPAVSAGRLGQLAPECLETIRSVLEDFGVAYQLQDDLADLFGLKGRGRPGQDLREGKHTGPVLHYMRSKSVKTAMADSRLSFAEQAARIAASPATQRTQDRIDDLCTRARSRIQTLPHQVGRVLSEAFGVLTEVSRQIAIAVENKPQEVPHDQRSIASAR